MDKEAEILKMESDGAAPAVEVEAPPWATLLFAKLKAEICAEVHARVAYSVRLMVDQAVERILQGVSSPQLQTVPTSDLLPTSRTINKEHRKEKKEKSRACKDLRKKMRRERKCGGNLVSSSTEGDAEADALIEKSGKSTLFKRESVRLVSVAPVSASPQPCSAENVEPGLTECTATANVTDKVLNSESDCAGDEITTSACMMVLRPNITVPDSIPGIKAAVENEEPQQQLPSFSDSEFEVVSMPFAAAGLVGNPVSTRQAGSCGLSWGKDSSNGSDLETEVEGGDDLDGLDNCAVTSTMTSSTCTIYDDFASNYSNDNEPTAGAAAAAQTSLELWERERSPYSATSQDVKQINSEEVVNTLPLPAEFERERRPYANVSCSQINDGAAPPPTTIAPGAPVQASEPTSTTGPRDTTRNPTRADAYRVNVLPESLWDEAMTVAAQVYNDAKSVVGSLVDPFPRDAEASSVGSVRRARPYGPLNCTQQRLHEMGFTDSALNQTLLARHNNDLAKVVAELLDP